jgi:hypothetical protein
MLLLDLLLAQAQGDPHRCPRCGAEAKLRLKFEFGLGARDSECTVLASFIPQKLESWSQPDGTAITFYPFLVILQRHGRKLAAWLPYWHVIDGDGKRTRKYGQWAPFMDFELFADLLNQARQSGYFEPHRA